MLVRWMAIGMLVAVAGLGCDRATEPYVPGEKPEQPDLSRIFPEGAERAAEKKPPPMGQGAGEAPPAAAAGGGESASAGGPVSGTITLAPAVASKVPAGAILFLIARNGPGGG